MYFPRQNIIFYVVLIIALKMHFIWPWPVIKPPTKDNNMEAPADVLREIRFSRQIVEPTWLNPIQQPTIDPTVHVNAEALAEADLIRKTIQKAVEKDTFAVNIEKPPGKDFMQPTTNAPHPLIPLHTNWQKLWQNWFQNLWQTFNN